MVTLVEVLGLPEIGRSTEGRPIRATVFGPTTAPSRLVVGGMHGNEPSSVEAAVELCTYLRDNPPTGCVWVLPALNPDGLAAGIKNSARDVDLNRNFPAANFTTTHNAGYFPGPSPLSEPETHVLAALVERLGCEGVVAVHAPFACVNYDGPAERWARAVAAACGWPAQADIGYPTPGSFGSWLGHDRGLPVLTLELPPGPYSTFAAQARAALQTAIQVERIR